MNMIKWRQKHPDHPNYVPVEKESSESDSSINSLAAVASSYRDTVKEKDAAAKERKTKGRRRG